MAFRPLMAVLGAAWLGAAVPLAQAQSTLLLKPTVEDGEDATPDAWRTVTSIQTLPVEEPPPARKQAPDTDPYAPVGIGMGGLRLYPSITVGGVYTSNPGGSPTDAEPDVGLELRPALRIESDWVRHSYSAEARGDFTFYAGRGDLDNREFAASNALRLDVRRGTTLSVSGSYILSQSGLEDSNVPLTAVGYETEHALTGSAALDHDFGPLQGRLRAGLAWRRFDDVKLQGGGEQDNSGRDYVEPVLALRATYGDPPLFKPFVEVAYAPRIYAKTPDSNGLDRDSQGFNGALGVDIDAGPVWAGAVALTYLHRDYDDPTLETINTLGLNGSVTWRPTELTTIVASAVTVIEESTSPTTSGLRDWDFAIDVTRGLRDNVDVSAAAGVQFSEASAGTDVTYDAGLDVIWKLNPMLAWTAGYDFTWLDAADQARDYSEHRLRAGVTLSR